MPEAVLYSVVALVAGCVGLPALVFVAILLMAWLEGFHERRCRTKIALSASKKESGK